MFPVEEKISEISKALTLNQEVVLSAPPGSGKTTCVPLALLNEPWLKGKKIIMLEPRRLAARACATFMAKKLGEEVGETVGYQVRLEKKVSSKTRLEVLTEGLLAQRLINDPELSDVGLIIFDEFHERSLACDLSFALTLDVKRALRNDLRIVVMSATIDSNEISSHLDNPKSIYAEGRMFPVDVIYLGDISMGAAISKALRETKGDILCFLPGEGEIRRARESLLPLSEKNIEVLPLYGALSKEEQDKVFYPSSNRKVILSTSIAETSITLPNITTVIDCGLMRIPRFSPSTGMSALVTVALSQDRAEQRCGRAGRVSSGVCYRLWDEGLNAMRPKKMSPEILDADLCSLVLTSASWGALKREALPWLTLPPVALWDQAVNLLKMLGALDKDNRLTAKGEKMSRLAMHPRLANMMLLAGEKSAILAAQIEEGSKSRETDVRMRPITPRIKELARRFSHIKTCGTFLSEGDALSLAYPDRIAKNRDNGSFRMVSGRGAFVDREDPLGKEKYIVCCDLDDRMGDAKLFLACPISEEEIISRFGDQIIEKPICHWDRVNDRVKALVERRLGEMVIGEKPLVLDDEISDKIAGALLDGIRFKGVENLPCWTKESLQMRERINFLHREIGGEWEEASDEALIRVMSGFILGLTKWRDLEKVDMIEVLDAFLLDRNLSRRELDKLAPMRMEVPSGSNMLIHYEGDMPTVEVRLQECFGLMSTPKVAGNRVPIVMTLLSPAQRPIQITKDLEGFWREGYQLVRKDLRGRYPKHYWPEDPFTATATKRTNNNLPRKN